MTSLHLSPQQCEGGSVPDNERVLLYIEKQAMVQVMIKVLAEHLDLRKASKVNQVCACVDAEFSWKSYGVFISLSL